SVSRSRTGFASLLESIRSRSARHDPSFGRGCTVRRYSKEVAPERRTLRTVFRDTFSSRTISLIDLPLTKRSRLIRAIVSTTNIPPTTRSNPERVSLHVTAQRRSKLDADHPSTGVDLPRRNTPEDIASNSEEGAVAVTTSPTYGAAPGGCRREMPFISR